MYVYMLLMNLLKINDEPAFRHGLTVISTY